MGNVKVLERFVRRLTKNSNGTISVTIPIEHAYELGWHKGDSVYIGRQGKRIIISESNNTVGKK